MVRKAFYDARSAGECNAYAPLFQALSEIHGGKTALKHTGECIPLCAVDKIRFLVKISDAGRSAFKKQSSPSDASPRSVEGLFAFRRFRTFREKTFRPQAAWGSGAFAPASARVSHGRYACAKDSFALCLRRTLLLEFALFQLLFGHVAGRFLPAGALVTMLSQAVYSR